MKTHITCSDFDQLPEETQTDVIWQAGVLLGRRTEGFYKIMLFQIDGFYTELWYHTHFNVLIKVASFSDTDLLEPYLSNIRLDGLFGEG